MNEPYNFYLDNREDHGKDDEVVYVETEEEYNKRIASEIFLFSTSFSNIKTHMETTGDKIENLEYELKVIKNYLTDILTGKNPLMISAGDYLELESFLFSIMESENIIADLNISINHAKEIGNRTMKRLDSHFSDFVKKETE